MRLHVVDGTYELFRAYFSKRPDHTTPDGSPFKAVAGLASSMLALLHDPDEQVTHIAVAFDNPVESFRNRLFDGYKTGQGMPADLASQFDPAEEAMAALGMVVWRMGEWEADDALATAAAKWRDDVDQVRIMTPDKDLGQSIRGDRVVQVDRRRQTVTNEAGLWTRRGVAPQSIPDYLALVGDSADGIPGLPRFGEKGTSTLLARYQHLESIPADPASWDVTVRGAKGLAATLQDRMADALLYRRLATLVQDVPLTETLEELKFVGVPRGRFAAWCDASGLRGMRVRPSRWAD